MKETEQVAGIDSATQALINSLSGKVEGQFVADLAEDMGVVVPSMEALLEMGNPAALARVVSERGLVIAPYGVGTPDEGLTDKLLSKTLEDLLERSNLEMLSYHSNAMGRIDMLVKGFTPVEVTPLIGDPLAMTEQAYVSWRLEPERGWRLWLLAPDSSGLLPLAELQAPEPAFSSEELAIIEIIDYMQAEDIDALMKLVPEDGLVIAPYAVGVSEKGLTGQALRQALRSMLSGTELIVEAHASTLDPGLTGFIITGLNPVEVQPAVGDPFVVTGYTLVELEQDSEGQFRLASLAVDVQGLMAEALAYPPFTDNPILLRDEQARAIIRNLDKSLQAGDVDSLANMVNYRGLIFGPYAVGLPNRGLTDEDLTKALEAILKDADPEVVSYERRIGGLSVVVTGLNRVEITPAVGDALLISSPALVELTQDKDESWILWAIVVDDSSLLKEGTSNYKLWK
ncbi:MAG TPA: hypothetical protein VE136_17250 [Anaerolineales bacterium]|jgi:hypothetical protein|nr:hypothetical protein [Anaerolineales bacterium]